MLDMDVDVDRDRLRWLYGALERGDTGRQGLTANVNAEGLLLNGGWLETFCSAHSGTFDTLLSPSRAPPSSAAEIVPLRKIGFVAPTLPSTWLKTPFDVTGVGAVADDLGGCLACVGNAFE